ncbi:MAG TPA: inorganic diphosphatase [Polyangiales bacterium]|nr:inorganic diphosphatase [Polyangiales bacterium]
MPFPQQIEVLIELPLHTIIKRREDGRVDFLSPLPCPYNYGSVPGTHAADGDSEDALVLGPRLPKGVRTRARVLARANFYDAGSFDGKWVCGDSMSERERQQLIVFFHVYARCKAILNWLRRKSGRTAFEGLELAPDLVQTQDGSLKPS